MRSLCALLIAALATFPQESVSAADRAVWIWEAETLTMLDDAAERARFCAFLRERGVSVVYLYADAYRGRNPIADEPAAYGHLVSGLHEEGLEVHALLGSAYLKTEQYVLPEKRGEAREMIARVLDYQAGAEGEARLDGVHFDIEPHVLPVWDSDPEHTLRLFLDFMQESVTTIRDRQPGLEISAAIPFWLDRLAPLSWQETTRPPNEHVQLLLDAAVLMDYRDEAGGSDGIVAHARGEIEFANREGRKVVVGVETGESDIEKTTFGEEGAAVMDRELALAAEMLAEEPSFAGFAIHHLESWMRLRP